MKKHAKLQEGFLNRSLPRLRGIFERLNAHTQGYGLKKRKIFIHREHLTICSNDLQKEYPQSLLDEDWIPEMLLVS